MIALENKAPDFSLPDQDGKMHSLSDFLGKWVLLYFYPKDDTPGCTTEACSFRDNFEAFRARDVVVIGISNDSVSSHKKFAEKYTLPFLLLADPDHATIAAYGAWEKKTILGKEFAGTLRHSVLITPTGTILKIYEQVHPEDHATEILADIDAKSS